MLDVVVVDYVVDEYFFVVFGWDCVFYEVECDCVDWCGV